MRNFEKTSKTKSHLTSDNEHSKDCAKIRNSRKQARQAKRAEYE